MTFKRKDKPLTYEEISNIFLKIVRVINSCETLQHVVSTRIYRTIAIYHIRSRLKGLLDIYDNRHDITYVEFKGIHDWIDSTRQLLNKKRAVIYEDMICLNE
jgi:hypothetical protein